jgi:2-phospho-L-lactate guanylyltransferase
VDVLAAVPVKRFYVAKRRLSPVLSGEARSRLGQDLARHTLTVVDRAGGDVVALAADEEVAEWARQHGWKAMVDQGGGLDGAAAAAAARASAEGRAWLIVHADLPLLVPADVAAALQILENGESPLAPSDDGGTSLIGGTGKFHFSYGPASFHRHLARLTAPRVMVRLGLTLDLDGPRDYTTAGATPGGEWLRRYAGS